MFLKLAPISESFDMFIAIGFCYVPVLIWFYFGWRASRSGSYVFTKNELGYKIWEKSDVNVSFFKTAQFKIGMLWLFFGSLFFWALLWPDHADVWFIK